MSHDARLGRFDAEVVREHLAGLRAIAAAVEELETEGLQSEIDRTGLLGEIRNNIFRLEHEQPHIRNPGFWLTHVFQGLYAVLARHDEAAGGRAPAALERLKSLPRFLDEGRATLDPAARWNVYRRLHTLLNEELPYLFLYTPVRLGAIHRRFAGLVETPLGPAMPHLWYVDDGVEEG